MPRSKKSKYKKKTPFGPGAPTGIHHCPYWHELKAFNMYVGARLVAIRENAGMSKKEIKAVLGKWWWEYENGKGTPGGKGIPLEKALRFAKVFNISLKDLMPKEPPNVKRGQRQKVKFDKRGFVQSSGSASLEWRTMTRIKNAQRRMAPEKAAIVIAECRALLTKIREKKVRPDLSSL